MNYNDALPTHQAYHFEETRKRSFQASPYTSDRFENGAESVNNYLKTLAEIDAEMISTNAQGMTTTKYRNELDFDGEIFKNGNNLIVSPDTLYHGFMEENY